MPEERPLPLNALRAFEAAARHLSFSRAAEELDVTPGAISQHVRTLEEAVGQPLFKRLGRHVILTAAAQSALPVLREGFDRIAEAGRLMHQPSRKGRIAVSVAPSLASKWLLPRLDRFQARHPDIEVWVSADMNTVDFATADVDLAIRYGAGAYQGLVADRLMQETVLAVASPALVADLAIAAPSDLARAPLLHDGSPEQDPSCPDWPMWLKARGASIREPSRGPRFNQTSLVIEAAVAGRGVALAKRAIAEADLKAGRLVALFDETAPLAFAYWLVWPKGRTVSQPVRAFIAWLKDEAA